MPKAKADIRSLARSHTSSAINVLRTIMNQPKAPAAARVAAAQALLDRGWGKAQQSMEITTPDGWADVLQSVADSSRPIPGEKPTNGAVH